MGNVLVPYGPGLEVETGYTQQCEELICRISCFRKGFNQGHVR